MNFSFIIRIAMFASFTIIQTNQTNVYSSNASIYPERYWQWEANFTPILRNTINMDNSSNIYGGRLAIANFFYNYPKSIELGLDASVMNIWSIARKNKADFSSNVTILSPAIFGRWHIYRNEILTPFLEAGIGPSYMTNDDFDGKKLGMRFAFQDIFSAGFFIPDPYSHHSPTKDNAFIVGVYVIHYSNGGLDKKNRGITLPVSLRLGYRF